MKMQNINLECGLWIMYYQLRKKLTVVLKNADGASLCVDCRHWEHVIATTSTFAFLKKKTHINLCLFENRPLVDGTSRPSTWRKTCCCASLSNNYNYNEGTITKKTHSHMSQVPVRCMCLCVFVIVPSFYNILFHTWSTLIVRELIFN